MYSKDEAELESPTPQQEPTWHQGLKHLDCLTKKVKVLEEENLSLRVEVRQQRVNLTGKLWNLMAIDGNKWENFGTDLALCYFFLPDVDNFFLNFRS